MNGSRADADDANPVISGPDPPSGVMWTSSAPEALEAYMACTGLATYGYVVSICETVAAQPTQTRTIVMHKSLLLNI